MSSRDNLAQISIELNKLIMKAGEELVAKPASSFQDVLPPMTRLVELDKFLVDQFRDSGRLPTNVYVDPRTWACFCEEAYFTMRSRYPSGYFSPVSHYQGVLEFFTSVGPVRIIPRRDDVERRYGVCWDAKSTPFFGY